MLSFMSRRASKPAVHAGRFHSWINHVNSSVCHPRGEAPLLSFRWFSSTYNNGYSNIPCMDPMTVVHHKSAFQQHWPALKKLHDQSALSLMASYAPNTFKLSLSKERIYEMFESVTTELQRDPNNIQLLMKRAVLALYCNMTVHAHSDALKIIHQLKSSKDNTDVIITARQIQAVSSIMMVGCKQFHEDFVDLTKALTALNNAIDHTQLERLSQILLKKNNSDKDPDYFLLQCLKLEEEKENNNIDKMTLIILQKMLLVHHWDACERFKLLNDSNLRDVFKGHKNVDLEKLRLVSMVSLSKVNVPMQSRSSYGGDRSPDNVLPILREICEHQIFENVKVTLDKEKRGLKMVAKRDIERNEIFLVERPWFTFSNAMKSRSECNHCLKDLSHLQPDGKCPQCGDYYCSVHCKEEASRQYHQILWNSGWDNFIASLKMDKLVSFFAFGIVSTLKLMVMAECRGMSIFDMSEFKILHRVTDSVEQLNDFTLMEFPFAGEKVVQVFKQFLKYCPNVLKNHGLEELVMALSGVSLNSMTQFADKNKTIRHTFLQLAGSFINHSCDPNTDYSHQEVDRQMRLKADRFIAKGDEITISYAYDRDPVIRRAKLFMIYGFECKCSICCMKKFSRPKRNLLAYDL